MKPLSLFFLLLLSLTTWSQEILEKEVLFESDKSELTETSKVTLNEIIRTLKNLEQARIELFGHTDDQGDISYNFELSKRRVNTVYDFFLENGIAPWNIELAFLGEEKPLIPNSTEEARRANRRVEIKIFYNDKPEQLAIEMQPEELPDSMINVDEIQYGNPYNVLAELKTEPQVFCIQNSKDTIVQGLDGTILFLPKNSFNDKEIECVCIEIYLTEFYHPAQLMQNNLNTEAGTRLLETRGAIKLEAYCGDKKLTLKKREEV